MKKKIDLFDIVNALIMIMLVIITLYPMYYVLIASLSEPARFLSYDGLLLLPQGFSIVSYQKAFEHPLILSSYRVTLFVLAAGLVINLLLTMLGAYALTRRKLFFKRFISFMIMFTMFFSGGLIPFYLTVKDLKLLDTVWSMILPTAINTFNLVVLRTAFASVPRTLEEAAEIDGAGHFTVLFRIIAPLTMPTMAVITLYYGVAYWNSWFNASIFLNDTSLYPLQLVLRSVLISNDASSMLTGVDAGTQLAVSETLKYALVIIATAPILVLYPFLQRFFVKGVMVGAVKG